MQFKEIRKIIKRQIKRHNITYFELEKIADVEVMRLKQLLNDYYDVIEDYNKLLQALNIDVELTEKPIQVYSKERHKQDRTIIKITRNIYPTFTIYFDEKESELFNFKTKEKLSNLQIQMYVNEVYVWIENKLKKNNRI